jgi:hypothetical protein
LKKQKAESIEDEQNSSTEKSDIDGQEDENEPNEQQENQNEETLKKPKSPRKRANSKSKGLIGGLISNAFGKEKQTSKQKNRK